MPYVEVTLETGSCAELPIVVDRSSVRLPPDTDLKFENDLDDDVDATVRFFNLDDKDGTAIGGFCEGMVGTEFLVLGDDEDDDEDEDASICKPLTSGDFAYTVTAANHQDLDPVLIIEPQVSAMQPGQPGIDLPFFDPVQTGVALLIGLIVGMLLTRRRG